MTGFADITNLSSVFQNPVISIKGIRNTCQEFFKNRLKDFGVTMILKIDEATLSTLSQYSLPSYREIPDVGLYLNQCATYINRIFEPLDGISITESMISNYVKKKLVANPVKKQYSRDSIAYLMFIAVAKTVVSLDDIQVLLALQKKNFRPEESYEYFRQELSSVMKYVFGLSVSLSEIGSSAGLEKELLRSILLTVSHKTYMDKAFSFLGGGKKSE